MAGKKISNLEWVARAAAVDDTALRFPVMTGIHVSDGQLAGTDGKRLHIAPNTSGLTDGIWRTDASGTIEGNIPGWRDVVSTAPHDLVVERLGDLLAVCSAAVAYRRAVERYEAWEHEGGDELVSLPCGDQYAYFNPRYLLDALDYGRPARSVFTITTAQAGPLSILRIDLDQDRKALVMPLRASKGHDKPAPRFDLSPFVFRVEREKAAKPAGEARTSQGVA